MQGSVILLGAGGHAKVLIDMLRINSLDLLGIIAPEPIEIGSAPYLGDDRKVLSYAPHSVQLVNGLGSAGSMQRRREIFESFTGRGYTFATLIHPSAVIASDVRLGPGVQIMAGSVIQTCTIIGANTIVNTRSSVDHDCVIGDHVHISPGVTLCGNVTIHSEVHIGAGSTIIQGRTVQQKSVVGAGSVVLSNIRAGSTVYGVPAKEATK